MMATGFYRYLNRRPVSTVHDGAANVAFSGGDSHLGEPAIPDHLR